MKHTAEILTTITLIAAFVLSGCDSQSNKMDETETSAIEANQEMENATNEVKAELSTYRAENSDRIMEYNRTISDIKKEIRNESDSDIRDGHEARLTGFETTHDDLKREIDNYKVSDSENWGDFKDSFSDRMDDLGDSLDDFFSTSATTTSSIN
ncbi:MAG: hypothetical protein R6V27_13250 [Balneolaceae bacterium]